MKKIKLIPIIIFLTCSNLINAQNEFALKEIDSVSKTMFQSVIDKDFDLLLEMTYSKIYDIIPKDMMLQAIKSIFEGNDEISIEILNKIPEYKISDIFTTEDKTKDYAFLSYSLKMKMIFNNKTYEDDETRETMINMMKIQGIDVSFETNNTLNAVIKNSITIFINDENTKNTWKTIRYDSDSPMFYQILPAEIIKHAKTYKEDLMIESSQKN